jgi:hypothetical protein
MLAFSIPSSANSWSSGLIRLEHVELPARNGVTLGAECLRFIKGSGAPWSVGKELRNWRRQVEKEDFEDNTGCVAVEG